MKECLQDLGNLRRFANENSLSDLAVKITAKIEEMRNYTASLKGMIELHSDLVLHYDRMKDRQKLQCNRVGVYISDLKRSIFVFQPMSRVLFWQPDSKTRFLEFV